jgi:TonB-linked SusC/RagA family outer membrane protein
MKKILSFIRLIMITIFLPVTLYAQQKVVVTGIVKDSVGNALAGASIVEKGVLGNATAAGENGKFKITLKGTSNTIEVSFTNYKKQEVNVKKTARTQGELEITLLVAPSSLNEVIVVGYGKKTRLTNTGAVGTITGAAIMDVPTSSVQNALTGQVPGFFSQQRSGQPGKDASDYFIRGVSSLNSNGNQPLIIVDDIEYTYDQLSQINVNEIESISILKDASTTAVFGIKGANGVLVVTTRRGVAGKPKFNLRVEAGLQNPVMTPKFLDAYHTAALVNEAYANDGLTQLFTQTDLDLFKSGTDPYGHPNVNWYDAIMRKSSMQANTNLDISGGTQSVKYFISGGAFTQTGQDKNFSTGNDGVNANYFYKRYNLRSNLDIQATRNFSLRLDMTARFGDINQPYNQNVISDLYNFADYHPYSAPFLNPNGSYAYAYDTQSQLPTLNALLATGGYSRQRRTDFNVLFGFTEKLDDITKGLSLTGRVAYAGVEQNTLNLARPYSFPPSYYFDPRDSTYHLNTGVSSGGYTLAEYRTIANTDLDNQRVNVQVSLNYERTFGQNHVSSLLFWNQESYRDDQATLAPQKFRGYSLKLGYDYKQKYLIDFNAGYNGSDRFQSSKRYGLFPAVGLGWNMVKENFLKKALSAFSLFKPKFTYGKVGSDVAPGNQYLYYQTYNQGSSYSFGQTPQDQGTIYEGALSNNNVTWEKSKKLDVGLDMNLVNDKIALSADYFHERRYDQLVTRQNIPEILGVGVSPENVAVTINRGYDGQITYKDRIGAVQFSLGLVWSYAKNKILYEAEAEPRYPWLAVTGRPINQPFGYTYIGFYSQSDVNDPKVAKPITAIPIQAGDLKYKDLNGDGVIDQNDMGPIGKPNLPNTTIGVPLMLEYKGFSIHVLFQGAYGYSLGLIGTAIEPFQSQFQPIHEKRWTPATAESAEFPRLTSNPTTINSPTNYMSDFWLINAHYVRLKTVDINYQIPKGVLPFKINNGRLYLSAYNLVTWSNVSKKYQQDPEVTSNSAGDAYLNQRVVNVGLQIGF